MFKLQKSETFLKQFREYAQSYKDRAGILVMKDFAEEVKSALNFIQESPFLCPEYIPVKNKVKQYKFRKWNMKNFPFTILFRVGNDNTIFIDVIYAQKMNIPARLLRDFH